MNHKVTHEKPHEIHTLKPHQAWLSHPKVTILSIKIRQKAIATQAWSHHNSSKLSMQAMDFHKAI